MNKNNDPCIDTGLKQAFEQGNIQLFVGSGLSHPPFKTANEFCQLLLQDNIVVDAMPTKLEDLIVDAKSINHGSLADIAEYYEMYAPEGRLIEMIAREFGERTTSTELHRRLWRLPHVKLIYTTNFDCLLEDAISRPKRSPKVATRLTQLRALEASSRIVYKPHGCARSSPRGELIITTSDFMTFSERRTADELQVLHDLIFGKTFLFLGYSLTDPNLHHIIHEAQRIAPPIRAYAVLLDPKPCEARNWARANVTLIKANAADFVESLLDAFPPDPTEWSQKIELRVDEKEILARKAIQVLHAKATRTSLVVLLDAGSSCYFLAKELVRELETERLPRDRVTIITNSPPVLQLLSDAFARLLRDKKESQEPEKEPREPLSVYSVGGKLRSRTRAITVQEADTGHLDTWFKAITMGQDARFVAFLGASAIDGAKVCTRNSREVELKRFFVQQADEVYMLADHSKGNVLRQPELYPFCDFDQVTDWITDRDDEMDQGRPFPDPPKVDVFTSKQVLDDGEPILYVDHAKDGQWSFHHDSNPSVDDIRIVALGNILKLDPTVIELADLHGDCANLGNMA